MVARHTGRFRAPYAHSRWLHLYINGVYWGIYQIEERPEAQFAANYLGGNSEQYDVIKNTGFSEDFHIELQTVFSQDLPASRLPGSVSLRGVGPILRLPVSRLISLSRGSCPMGLLTQMRWMLLCWMQTILLITS